MKLIAIESSERMGSLCAIEQYPGGRIETTAVTLPEGVRSAQSLAPALRALLDQVGWLAEELDAVAVASGPGSFTGLRIGVTTAKMLAYAASCGVAEVNSLHAIARQAGFADRAGWAVMDAQRGELFAARVHADGACGPTRVLTREEWLAGLAPGDWASGPVAAKLSGVLPDGVALAPESAWAPRAETIAELALPAVSQHELLTPAQVLPRYFRLSAAEEKRLKQPDA